MKLKFKIIAAVVLISSLIHLPLLAQKITPFNGLVSNIVYALYEEKKNTSYYIWIGTAAGLGKYDGSRWEEFDTSNSKLVNAKVNAILQDRKGDFWFGTDNGISKFDGQSWTSYVHQDLPARIPAESILCLFIDTKSNLWIGTNGGGLVKVAGFMLDADQQKWLIYDTGNSGIKNDIVTAINEDSQGNLWIGTLDAGIHKFDGSLNWQSYSDIASIGNQIRTIFKGPRDTLWIGTNNGVVRTYDGSQWLPCLTEKGPLPEVYSIANDREGNLWFGTVAGEIYKYNGVSCVKSSVQVGQKYRISCLLQDHSGDLLVGTDGAGLYRIHLNWQLWRPENLPPGFELMNDVDEDRDGNLWIATVRNGIIKLNSSSFQLIGIPEPKEGANSVNSILVDHNNNIWCATDYGAHQFDGVSNWSHYHEPLLANDTVNVVIQDRQGNIWVGTNNSVSRFDGNFWTTLDTTDGLPAKQITDIWEDHQSHFWFATNGGGVCEFVHDSVKSVYKTDKLSDCCITAIIQDQNNDYWFGTTKQGIAKFDGTSWKNFTQKNSGLSSNYVKCLFQDHQNNIWVGSFDGMLDKFDGLFWWDFSDEVNVTSVNAIYQDMTNNFWICTHSGLFKYSPDRDSPDTYVVIHPRDTSSVASNLFVFSGQDTETPTDKLVYSWMYSTRAGDHNSGWSQFQKDFFQEVGPLRSGEYSFLVKAKDQEGNIDFSPAKFDFIVDVVPPTTMIERPHSDEIVSGKVAIIGTVFDTTSLIKDFKHYWLDYARGESIESIKKSDWKIMNTIDDTLAGEVYDDTLITWEANSLSGSYFIRLSATDSLNHSSQFYVRVTVVETLKEINNREGGSMQNLHKQLQIYVPPGALASDVLIFANPVDTAMLVLPHSDQIKYSTLAYHLGPEKMILSKPATLTFNYADAEISNLTEKKLSIMFFDSQDDFALLGGFIDPEKNLIRTAINKFGTYILAEDNMLHQGQEQISAVNCQPRIFSPRGTGFSAVTTISFNLAVDQEITIKIYNLAGRLVKVLVKNRQMNAGANAIDWDGRDHSGETCPSDLYIVAIEGEKEVKTKTVVILNKSNN